jgi:hypothetical protein
MPNLQIYFLNDFRGLGGIWGRRGLDKIWEIWPEEVFSGGYEGI